jgi:hypothetical protein
MLQTLRQRFYSRKYQYSFSQLLKANSGGGFSLVIKYTLGLFPAGTGIDGCWLQSGGMAVT